MEFASKSVNIKIPLSIALILDDRAHLNPNYLSHFIATHIEREDFSELITEPVEGRSFNYTFKMPSNVHKALKLKSIEHDAPMNELAGRLLVKLYHWKD